MPVGNSPFFLHMLYSLWRVMTWKGPKMEAETPHRRQLPWRAPRLTKGSFCKQEISFAVLSHMDFGVFLLLQQNLDYPD